MLKRVNLEISNICNVQCSFCPVVERDKKIMTLEQFKKIVKQLKPITERIALHLMGEPLAHPKLKEFLQVCDEEELAIEITTNGLLLKRYQDLILQSSSIVQVNFSLQAYQDNFPHKDFRQYFIPILEFCEKVNTLRPEVYINFRLWNQGSSAHNKSNEEIFREIEIFFGVTINREVDVGHIKSKRIWNRVYLHFDSRFEWPSLDATYQGIKGRCHGLTGHIGVHADGTVVPCCLDSEAKIPLGNCLETDISTVLSSDRAVKMKEGFKRGELVEKLCQHCAYIKRFTK